MMPICSTIIFTQSHSAAICFLELRLPCHCSSTVSVLHLVVSAYHSIYLCYVPCSFPRGHSLSLSLSFAFHSLYTSHDTWSEWTCESPPSSNTQRERERETHENECVCIYTYIYYIYTLLRIYMRRCVRDERAAFSTVCVCSASCACRRKKKEVHAERERCYVRGYVNAHKCDINKGKQEKG